MRYVIIAWLTLTCMIACRKENIDYFIADPGNIANDTVWRDVIAKDAPIVKLRESLEKPYLVATLDATTGGVVNFDDYLQINFPPNSFTISNKEISGNVIVWVAALQKKGDMVRFSKPTTSRSLLLESAASFDIRVTKDNEQLLLAPGKNFTVNYVDKYAKEGMQVFYGNSNLPNDLNFDWLAATDSSGIRFWKDSTGNIKGYELTAKQLGWVNCDSFLHPSANAPSTISVFMPLNFTNNNTVVYAVFENTKTVVGLTADAAHKIFTTDNMPAGSNVTLVSISRLGNDYYLGIKDITVSNLQRVDLKPEKRSLPQIGIFLDTL